MTITEARKQIKKDTERGLEISKEGTFCGTELNPSVYTDSPGFSYRLDGNNVDIDTETAKLAENQIKYNGIMAGVNQEFSNLKLVMK